MICDMHFLTNPIFLYFQLIKIHRPLPLMNSVQLQKHLMCWAILKNEDNMIIRYGMRNKSKDNNVNRKSKDSNSKIENEKRRNVDIKI